MQRKFYPGLQGLRGVAAGLVFFAHYIPLVFPGLNLHWGSTGVDLFFVLSGFLITSILRGSRDQPDYFRRFYRNRAYRVFPVFYGLWLLLFVSTPWLRPVWTWRILSVPLYLGNFFQFGHVAGGTVLHLGVGHGHLVLMIAQLWTLTVEEHFYLVWPLVVWWVGSLRRLRAIAFTGSVFTLLLRCYLVFHLPQALLDRSQVYYSTYTRVDSILIGSLLGLWLEQEGSATRMQRQRMAGWLTWMPAALLVAGGLFLPTWHNQPAYDWRFETYGITLVAVLCCGLLLTAMDENSILYRLLTVKPLMSLGLISYSFYMLHFIPYNLWDGVLQRLPGTWPVRLLMLLVMFAVTWAVSAMSYRWVELPFLRLKDRTSKEWRRGSQPVALRSGG